MLLLTIREVLACVARFSAGVIQDESVLRVDEDRHGCSGKNGLPYRRVYAGPSLLKASGRSRWNQATFCHSCSGTRKKSSAAMVCILCSPNILNLTYQFLSEKWCVVSLKHALNLQFCFASRFSTVSRAISVLRHLY